MLILSLNFNKPIYVSGPCLITRQTTRPGSSEVRVGLIGPPSTIFERVRTMSASRRREVCRQLELADAALSHYAFQIPTEEGK